MTMNYSPRFSVQTRIESSFARIPCRLRQIPPRAPPHLLSGHSWSALLAALRSPASSSLAQHGQRAQFSHRQPRHWIFSRNFDVENAHKKSDPEQGRETTARQQHCSEETPTELTDLTREQGPQQTRIDTSRASGSDSIALVTAAIAVHSGMRPSALCCATSKPHSWVWETTLPRHYPLESDAWAPIPTLALNSWYAACFAEKHIDTS